jgi:hypothetical protein
MEPVSSEGHVHTAPRRLWRRAITAGLGGDRKSEEAKIKNDNVILDPKAKQGNSKAYTLDRLERERPDLFARVVATSWPKPRRRT